MSPRRQVYGYITGGDRRWQEKWHADPTCDAILFAMQDTLCADTLTGLAREQANNGRRPCPACAYDLVLSALAGACAGPGWHALTCGATHTGTWAMPICPQCDALLEYARERGVLTPTNGNRVALLIPGAAPAPPLDDLTLPRMRLSGHNAAGNDLPTPRPAEWDTAAALIADGTPLALALAAAASLHAGPARTLHH